MAMLSSRNRLIYFRVSEEELERIRSLAETNGSRSVSDLAREAIERMQHMRTGPAGQSSPETDSVLLARIHSLQETVKRMDERLQDLSQKLTQVHE